MSDWIKIVLCFLVLIAVGVLGFHIVDMNNQRMMAANATKAHHRAVEHAKQNAQHHDLGKIEREIRQLLAGDTRSYSVYLWYADDADAMVLNNNVRRSASMIKVFIMAHAFDEARQGKLALSDQVVLHESDKVGGAGALFTWANGSRLTVRQLIEMMITESDNTATNMLIDYLGMDGINRYLAENGYNDTKLRNKMMTFGVVDFNQMNVTSARDLGEFFRRIYTKKCVAGYDTIMRDILLGQTDTECFPEALPEARIAHKTGELNGLYNDGGIINTARGDFVLVVLNDDVDRDIAIDKMRNVARTAYAWQ